MSAGVTTLAAEVMREDDSLGGGSPLLSRIGSVFGAAFEGRKVPEPELTVENMPPEPLEELLELEPGDEPGRGVAGGAARS